MNELQTAREIAAAELARIDAELAAASVAQRSERIAQVRSLMTEHSITIADIAGKISHQATTKLRAVKATSAPLYRNPENQMQTWAGRGKRSRWLVDALAAGKTLQNFRISA